MYSALVSNKQITQTRLEKEEIQLWPKTKKLKRWNRVKEKGERGLMTRKKPKVGKSLSYMYGWCAC